ncbi:efflux RND transporter periplasmic adaptor subunit [Allochromatium palmeri]|uniref:Efflux RND transporter periplasmic adaptor subunit n=1 Tax=Allochromatium palmeri TaxID=231048 RepID=A0A6N8EHT6_9GAMM|nr:efflux RND transporter periplasmic adaptor subunit [Allochromatium palmeri]MTW22459.1 efflux RND transporter periplasmic adaptor subunit [Allochromatium palmeri]
MRVFSMPILMTMLVWLAAPNAWAAKSDGAPAATPVVVAEARVQPLSERVEALGTLQANESVAITSKVTETISVVHFDDNQRVRAGDPLVEMTSAEEHALLEEANVRAREAERQYNRVRSLVTQRSASESLLDERKRDLDTARALLVAIESRVADRFIKAPFDGVLGLRTVSQGALVEPGDLITTLDDDRLMKLDFSVPSVHLASLQPGLGIEATSSAFGEQVFRGVVRGVDSRIDPVTRSVRVRAILPNPDFRLKPGLLMRVVLLLDPREALMVPEAAVLHRGQEHFVLRVQESEAGLTAERTQIHIGTRIPGWVEVRDGLAPGERVVTEGQEKVRPGQPIRFISSPGATNASSAPQTDTTPDPIP